MSKKLQEREHQENITKSHTTIHITISVAQYWAESPSSSTAALLLYSFELPILLCCVHKDEERASDLTFLSPKKHITLH